MSTEIKGTYELALWCKLLRDRGWTGPMIAESIGRSEGYVNNLIRIVERVSLGILLRWKAEQDPHSPLPPVCATDWLIQICLLTYDAQDSALSQRISNRY